ncbi:MAG: PAS domain S-box protein [Bacteroidota bacterium]
MKTRDLKISTQLRLGFTLLMLLVFILGVVSYWQADKISDQTENIFKHPFKVQETVANIKLDILNSRIAERDLYLAENKEEIRKAILNLKIASDSVHQRFDIIYEFYLGPHADVAEAYKACVAWKMILDKNIHLALAGDGDLEKAKQNILSTGNVRAYREKMMARIEVIDNFAKHKAEELFTDSQELNDALNHQLLILVAVILLLSFIIYFIIYRNIQTPLKELTYVTQHNHEGSVFLKSSFQSKNEFGKLSASFNMMLDLIKIECDEKDMRAAELVIANKELVFQTEEKEKRAQELIIANKELEFQNQEKEKRAKELSIANQKFVDLNHELENIVAQRTAELQEATDYLENLFFYASAPIVVWNREFQITRFNPAFEKLTGRKAEEVFGKSIELLFPPESAEKSMKLIKESHQGGRLETVEMEIIHLNGTISIILLNSASVYEEDQKTSVATIAQGQDITERKHAENKLKESEERYRSLMFNLEAGIVVHSPDTSIVMNNDRASELLGLSQEQMKGKVAIDPAWEFIHEDSTPLTLEEYPVNRIVTSRQPIKDQILGVLQPNKNDIVWLTVNGFQVLDHKGAITEIVISFIDISERKKVEEEIKNTLLKLQRSNQELEQFAYVASHDLQEPLRMVSSYTQLLSKRYSDKLDSDAQEFIAYAVSGATRMQTLINDLLDYSRLNTRKKAMLPADCHSVLGKVRINLATMIEERKALITCDELPRVVADETQLIQLFQNLISNGIKYNHSETLHIHISASEEKNEWIFSIKDNGIGMEKEFHERIFRMFQRLHSKNEYSGTGIGLAICKRIVERHGGRIWLESELGKGSVFYFTLAK